MPETTEKPATVIFRCTPQLKGLLDGEARHRLTNKTVLINEILSAHFGIEYEPSTASARRTTPHGGGPRRAES
jgi:hypothetical protein